jgi:hypothetical protein
MKAKRTRWALLGGLMLVAATAWVLVPLAFGQAQKTTCKPLTKPHMEMNTVDAVVVKTVAMEKEVFACRSSNGGFMRDLETFVELTEAVPDGVRFLEAEVAVATAICDKPIRDPVSATCSAQAVEVGTGTVELGRCEAPDPDQQPEDPVAMNSIAVPGVGPGQVLAKTIKVDKEVFSCERGIADVYIFTEIGERGFANAEFPNGTVQTDFRRFVGVVCLKSVKEGRIVGCDRFAPKSP